MTKNKFPAELLDSVTAITEPSFAIDNCAEYVACTNKGYLIEVRRNMIVQNLNVEITDTVDLFCYYDWIGNDCNCYYVLRGASGLLAVVHKQSNCLKIVEKRKGVRNIRLQDLENCGQPKIVLNGNLNDSNDNPEVLTISRTNSIADVENFDLNNQSLLPILSKTVQEMQGSYDALAKENQMKNWLIQQHLEGSPHSGLEETLVDCNLPPGTSSVVTPVITPPPLIINNHFSKVSSPYWIILIQIDNISDRCISDLQVLPFQHYADEFRWHLDTGTSSTHQLRHTSKNFIIISARFPVFENEKGMVEFEIRYDKHFLKTPKIHLSAKDIASGSLDLFKDPQQFDIDLICLRATHLEYSCVLKLSAPVLSHLVRLLQTEMGVRELRSCTSLSNYWGESSAFVGLFIKLHHHHSQQVQIYAKNSTQLDIFVKAFKNCLPDETNLEIMDIETSRIVLES